MVHMTIPSSEKEREGGREGMRSYVLKHGDPKGLRHEDRSDSTSFEKRSYNSSATWKLGGSRCEEWE